MVVPNVIFNEGGDGWGRASASSSTVFRGSSFIGKEIVIRIPKRDLADIYVGLTTERADRAAFSGDYAAAELRRLSSEGVLEHAKTEAVLAAAGHAEQRGWQSRGREHPGGLTGREVEVLRLVARGLTTRQIADRLYISPKTADHHIQHVYTKSGVSTRAAAALWAMQHVVVV
jgi:DNA-binding CsgD family transcriptional regulator